MKLKWLHISDIHYHFSTYESDRLREDMLQRIESESKRDPFDMVFCTGDLADKNGSFDNGLVKYLNEISCAVDIPKENFIIVPGNHDHDRNCAKSVLDMIYDYDGNEYSAGCNDKQYIDQNIKHISTEHIDSLLSSFAEYLNVYSCFSGNDYYIDRANPHIFVPNNDIDVGITKINTAWLDRDSQKSPDELRCGPSQLYDALKTGSTNNNSLKIALGHHPLQCFEEHERSLILDAFRRNCIEIYFCGHVHRSAASYYAESNLLEVICTSGKHDSNENGGFSIGAIDDNMHCYNIDFFLWRNGFWAKDTSIEGSDENGRYYIQTDRFKHTSEDIVLLLKTYGAPVPAVEIRSAVKKDTYEVLQYPHSNIDTASIEWDMEGKLISETSKQILKKDNKRVHIFPIAPIPLLIQLGFELQNNSKIEIFQHNRENNKWVCESSEPEPEYEIKPFISNGHRKLALVISCSTEINDDQIEKHISLSNFDTIRVDLKEKGLGIPLYRNQYMAIIRSLFRILSPIASRYDEIHVFSSTPAGMSIEIGRHIQRGVFNTIVLYNYLNGYEKVILLNEKSDKSALDKAPSIKKTRKISFRNK